MVAPSPLGALKVSQFLAYLAYGDAVSLDCLEIDRILAEWGVESRIFAERIDSQTGGKARPLTEHRPSPHEVVIFHYSLWSEVVSYLSSLRPPRLVVVYHNITPAEYFRGMNPQAEEATQRGRGALAQLAPITALALGDSEFNRRELEAVGFQRTGVLPIPVDFQRLERPINQDLADVLNDGYVNFLSVGRVVPNKRLEDVIKVFYHYKRHINPYSRLFLVGSPDMGVPYQRWLEALVEYLGLEPDMRFAGRVPLADLMAYYRSSRAYICMSEHEGFCLPIVESMYLGTPVLAYSAAAVPETLGDGGVLFRRKDYVAVAEMLHLMVSDGPLRERLVTAGRRRAGQFARERVAELLAQHLGQVAATEGK